jgi:hypothetical protein
MENEKIKIKANRGEGTIDQWYAAQMLTASYTTYVPDNEGNWADTKLLNGFENELYKWRQATGEIPLLKTWKNNHWWDSEGNIARDERGVTTGTQHTKPYLRAQNYKPELPYYANIKNIHDTMVKIKSTLSWPTINHKVVVVASTVQSPHSDKHIRIFTSIPLKVKELTLEKTWNGSRIAYLPSGEATKKRTYNLRLRGTDFKMPSTLCRKITLTAEMMQDFNKFYDENIGFVKKLLADAEIQRTKQLVNSKVGFLMDKMRQYESTSQAVKDSAEKLVDKIVEYDRKVATGRKVADALLEYYQLDIDLDTIEGYSQLREQCPNYDATQAINSFTLGLKTQCPTAAHERLITQQKQTLQAVNTYQQEVLKLAPIGGEELITAQMTGDRYQDKLHGAKTVAEFVSIVDGKFGGDEE